jgi:hypothetical protein
MLKTAKIESAKSTRYMLVLFGERVILSALSSMVNSIFVFGKNSTDRVSIKTASRNGSTIIFINSRVGILNLL